MPSMGRHSPAPSRASPGRPGDGPGDGPGGGPGGHPGGHHPRRPGDDLVDLVAIRAASLVDILVDIPGGGLVVVVDVVVDVARVLEGAGLHLHQERENRWASGRADRNEQRPASAILAASWWWSWWSPSSPYYGRRGRAGDPAAVCRQVCRMRGDRGLERHPTPRPRRDHPMGGFRLA